MKPRINEDNDPHLEKSELNVSQRKNGDVSPRKNGKEMLFLKQGLKRVTGLNKKLKNNATKMKIQTNPNNYRKAKNSMSPLHSSGKKIPTKPGWFVQVGPSVKRKEEKGIIEDEERDFGSSGRNYQHSRDTFSPDAQNKARIARNNVSSADSSAASTIVTTNSAMVLRRGLRRITTKEKKTSMMRSRIVNQIIVEPPSDKAVELDINAQVGEDSKRLISGTTELDVSPSMTITTKILESVTVETTSDHDKNNLTCYENPCSLKHLQDLSASFISGHSQTDVQVSNESDKFKNESKPENKQVSNSIQCLPDQNQPDVKTPLEKNPNEITNNKAMIFPLSPTMQDARRLISNSIQCHPDQCEPMAVPEIFLHSLSCGAEDEESRFLARANANIQMFGCEVVPSTRDELEKNPVEVQVSSLDRISYNEQRIKSSKFPLSPTMQDAKRLISSSIQCLPDEREPMTGPKMLLPGLSCGVEDEETREPMTVPRMLLPGVSCITEDEETREPMTLPQMSCAAKDEGHRYLALANANHKMHECKVKSPYKDSDDNLKHGVRWDDEPDAAMQIRRSKRILSRKTFHECIENKMYDEEFLNMLALLDSYDLNAVITAICADSDPKNCALVFSDRSTSRNQIYDYLAIELQTKVELMKLLVKEEDHDKAGKDIARLWFSIKLCERKGLGKDLVSKFPYYARKCTYENLNPFPPSLWGKSEHSDLTSLMSDNPEEEMPQEVWSTGVSAIDKFADAVLSFFPNNGKGVTLVNSPVVDLLMSKLGLSDLSSEISCWNDFSDIFQFAMTVANEMKKNPILISFGAAWSVLEPTQKEAFLPEFCEETDVRYAVAYCFLQYVLCKEAISSPRSCDTQSGKLSFLERLVYLLETKANRNQEKDKWTTSSFERNNSFERNKRITIHEYIKEYAIPIKSGLDDEKKYYAHPPLNIINDMCSTLWRSEDVAEAGLELLINPPGSRGTLDKILNCEETKEWITTEGVSKNRKGVLLHKAPLPRSWNNLLQAWSLATSSTNFDAPFHIATIISPILSAKNGVDQSVNEGLYLSAHCLSMHIHMHYTMFFRLDSNSPHTTITDFRSNFVTKLLVLLTKEAGKQYKSKLDKILTLHQNKGLNILDNAKNSLMMNSKHLATHSVWNTTKTTISSLKGVKDIPRNLFTRMGTYVEEW